jgi:sugar lactone lactonase YvrE
LVWELDADHTLADYTADYVIGQTDFTSNATGTTRSTFGRSVAVVADEVNQRLYVADQVNERVLMFDYSGGFSNGMDATAVLGQENFTSKVATITQDGMDDPVGIDYDPVNERLFVSDNLGERVMIFDTSDGVTTGENAAYVLGQPDFVTAGENLDQDGLAGAVVVAYNSVTGHLFVTDGDYLRIMVWDLSGGITTGVNADYVLGQPDFNSTSTAVDDSSIGGSAMPPAGVAVDETNNRLFVSDTDRNRILVWELANGIENGMPASYVLGQDDFVTSGFMKNGNFAEADAGFIFPFGLDYDESTDRFYASDVGVARIMIFDLSAPTPTQPSSSFSYTHPPLCQATFSPNTITQGESTTLSWNVTWPTNKQNNYYTKVPGEGLYSSSVQSLTLQPQHTTEYTIAVFNLWGANFCNTTITVLDENGEEATSNRNSNLTAGVSNSPIVRAILNAFRSLFVK